MFGIMEQHWHPLIVHFPIALWAVGTVFYLLAFISNFSFLRQASIWMGLIGTGLGYIAVESGEKAAEILGAKLCPMTSELLLRHSDQAETAFVFMLSAWLIAAIQEYVLSRYLGRFSQFKIFQIISSVALILGMVFLIKTGHKGFRLVYEEQVGIMGAQQNCR
jgi:uncharacterized membrane protein